MKWLIVIFLFFLPFFSFSQQELPYQNGIGIHLTHTAKAGLGFSFRYRRQLSDKGVAKIEFNTNHKDTYFVRIGYEPFRFRWTKFELGIGVDLKYEFNDYSKYNVPDLKELSLELPIELRYNINDVYNIYGGFSLSKPVKTWNALCTPCNQTIAEIRFGLGYNF